jgi:hypothetical protein
MSQLRPHRPLAVPLRVVDSKKWEYPFSIESWQGSGQFKVTGAIVLKLEGDNSRKPQLKSARAIHRNEYSSGPI